MKLLSKKVKTLIVSGMILNSTLVRAEVSTALSAQAIKVAEIKARFDELKSQKIEIEAFNKALREAKNVEGSWQLRRNRAQEVSNWSKIFLIPTLVLKAGMSAFPNFVFPNRKPHVMAIMVISGVSYVLGYAVEDIATGLLNMSESQKIEAENNIANVRELMEVNKASIISMSQDLGAKINNNIISFEGIPDSVKALGGTSFLNLNEIK